MLRNVITDLRGTASLERATTDRTATFVCSLGTMTADACSMRSDTCALGSMCGRSKSDGVERCG